MLKIITVKKRKKIMKNRKYKIVKTVKIMNFMLKIKFYITYKNIQNTLDCTM